MTRDTITSPTATAAVAPGPASLRSRLHAAAARVPTLHAASAGAFLVLVGGAGVSYLAQVATARILGVESFGAYAYVLAWVTLLAYLSTLGLHISLLRLVPAFRARQDWSGARGVIRFALAGVAIAGPALSLAVGASIGLLNADRPEIAVAALFGAVAAPLLALQLVGAALARAFGSVVLALAPERLGRDAIAVSVLALLVFGGLAPPAAGTAMAAMLASAAVTLCLTAWLARGICPAQIRDARPRRASRSWLRPMLPLTAIMIADVVMGKSGVIVLGLVADTRAAGVFAAAVALATLSALPRMAVAAAFAPTVADLHARGDRAGLQALLGRAAVLSLAGAALVAVPLVLAAPVLLGLFGAGFADGTGALRILVLGQLVAAAAGPQQHLMTMTGREGAGAAMQTGSAVLGVALCAPLAARFGVDGAAAAATAALVCWNIAMIWFALSRLGLRPGLVAAPRRIRA